MLIRDFYPKLLQGKQFRIFRNVTLNLDELEVNDFINKSNILKYQSNISNSNLDTTKSTTKYGLQECVGHHANNSRIKNTNKAPKCSVCKNSSSSITSSNQRVKDMTIEDKAKKEAYVKSVRRTKQLHRAAMCVRRK